MVVASPRFGATRLKPEQPEHPSFVRQAATATELVSKPHVMDREPQRRRLRLDGLNRADLARLHDLVLIEKEDGDPSSGDELVYLGTPGSQFRLGEAVDRSFPDAVGLIADQHFDVVRPCLHKAVEVLEHILDPR